MHIVRTNPGKAPTFRLMMTWLAILLSCASIPKRLLAQEPPAAHFSTFAAGSGPMLTESVYRLLDETGTPGQSNAVAFDTTQEDAFERLMLRCRLRVLEGGDGGAFMLLNTAEYGRRGPSPFVKSWVEPNLAGTFAVGIDVHNPPSEERTGPLGNYQGLPEREVSLHWDGREIVKRVAPAEFRGDFTELEITVQHVIGGAEITVQLAGVAVYENYFLAGMAPYESRLAIGAGTRDEATTEFDIREIAFTQSEPAQPRRAPKHIEVFNHVVSNRATPSHTREVALPDLKWAYGRVIMTLEIHDAGPDWDGWDKTGHLYVIDRNGVRQDIVPFITSYRTPCYWQVDVTHFRPWLAGPVQFELKAGSAFEDQRGYMMSMALDFYHGTPELEAYRILPLWAGLAKYASADNHYRDFFTPQAVDIDSSAQAARLFITTTGHSPVGEFTPSRRTVVFKAAKEGAPGTERRFSNVLWRADCYLNPVRPQHGTWKYARAGWAPGDIVRPWWIDLTPYMIPGKTAELRYEPEPYDFSEVPEDQRPTDEQINQAVQLVRAYLILYRSPTDLVTVPTIEVLEVESGSNAERGGLKTGDFLESYDGKRPETIDQLLEMIRIAAANGQERIAVVVYRDALRLELELDPGRMGVKIAEELRH